MIFFKILWLALRASHKNLKKILWLALRASHIILKNILWLALRASHLRDGWVIFCRLALCTSPPFSMLDKLFCNSLDYLTAVVLQYSVICFIFAVS